MIAAQDFDVVLSDISMPEMDGFELLRRIHMLPEAVDLPALVRLYKCSSSILRKSQNLNAAETFSEPSATFSLYKSRFRL